MSKLKDFLIESRKPRILNELFVNLMDIQKITQPQRDLQMLRLAITAELDAVNLYESMARMTTNRDLRDVLLDVAREEKVHVGEFEELLEDFDEDFEDAREEGEEEIENMGV